MEKDQMDSLATVAVGSEKIPPPPHSHYAPSEVYSSSEVPPPAYSRPVGRSTAVQIARIIATTLIAMSVIIGCFILAAAWLQARASCTTESIAIQQPEPFRRLQPEALIQEEPITKETLQTIEKDQADSTKESKSVKDDTDTTKTDNESGDENENDDDYDDPEFPPVHIKLPLQLDLDDLAGTIMQQARSLVSCVVERRHSDELPDNSIDSNATDPKRLRLGSERVAIICESGEPRRQEQQEQELVTPLTLPLGLIPFPMQAQEQDYHRYTVPNDNQRAPINFRILQQPINAVPNPQMLDIMPPQRMQPRPQLDMRPVPIDLRPLPVEAIHGMRPPSDQEQQHHFFPQEENNYHQQEQQPQGMVPPPPPPPPQASQEHRMMPQVIIRQQVEQRQPEESQERPVFPFAREFQGIPLEIRRIIQQVPLEIKNIIQQITGETGRPTPIPEGARREPVQDFKPFPEPSLMLPIEVRNLLEHGNIEGRRQESSDEQEEAKPFPGPEDQGEDEEKKFGVPPHIRNFIQQVVQGRAFPIPRVALPIRAGESFEVPMEVSARVIGTVGLDDKEQQHAEEQQPAHQPPQMHPVEETDDKRPHYVQPRSVRSARSVPEAFHQRTKRSRQCSCACDC